MPHDRTAGASTSEIMRPNSTPRTSSGLSELLALPSSPRQWPHDPLRPASTTRTRSRAAVGARRGLDGHVEVGLLRCLRLRSAGLGRLLNRHVFSVGCGLILRGLPQEREIVIVVSLRLAETAQRSCCFLLGVLQRVQSPGDVRFVSCSRWSPSSRSSFCSSWRDCSKTTTICLDLAGESSSNENGRWSSFTPLLMATVAFAIAAIFMPYSALERTTAGALKRRSKLSGRSSLVPMVLSSNANNFVLSTWHTLSCQRP